MNPVKQVKQMLRKDLALALGISGASVSKLAKRGMPTHDVDAAHRWRRRHLNPAMTKENRFEPAAAVPAVESEADGVSELAHAQRMADLADEMLPLGKLAAVMGDLRLAMHHVPAHRRQDLQMALPTWRALVVAVLEVVERETDVQTSDNADRAGLSDGDADELGAFWFSVAAGEIGVPE